MKKHSRIENNNFCFLHFAGSREGLLKNSSTSQKISARVKFNFIYRKETY